MLDKEIAIGEEQIGFTLDRFCVDLHIFNI